MSSIKRMVHCYKSTRLLLAPPWLEAQLHLAKRDFFPFGSTRKQFQEQNYTRFTPQQLYDIVVDVDRYSQFLPNCIESNVVSQTDKMMEADVIVGIPHLVTEKYRSIIHLHPPHRVRINSLHSKVLKHLESEWRFKAVKDNRTLITFYVEYEFHSHFHANLMNMFIDDITRRTMRAFVDRARAIYSRPKGSFIDDDSYYP